MMSVSSKVKFNESVLKMLEKAQKKALNKTAEATLTQIRVDNVMPFDTGTLQNDSTSVQENGDSYKIVSNTPYARRLYFHPEINFHKVNNSNASAKWFEPYINGSKKEFVVNAYAKFYKREAGL